MRLGASLARFRIGISRRFCRAPGRLLRYSLARSCACSRVMVSAWAVSATTSATSKKSVFFILLVIFISYFLLIRGQRYDIFSIRAHKRQKKRTLSYEDASLLAFFGLSGDLPYRNNVVRGAYFTIFLPFMMYTPRPVFSTRRPLRSKITALDALALASAIRVYTSSETKVMLKM